MAQDKAFPQLAAHGAKFRQWRQEYGEPEDLSPLVPINPSVLAVTECKNLMEAEPMDTKPLPLEGKAEKSDPEDSGSAGSEVPFTPSEADDLESRSYGSGRVHRVAAAEAKGTRSCHQGI